MEGSCERSGLCAGWLCLEMEKDQHGNEARLDGKRRKSALSH